MKFYEVEYREKQDLPSEEDRPWTRIAPQPADVEAIRIDDLTPEVTYEIRIRTVELQGEASEWAYLDPVTPTVKVINNPVSFPVGFKIECDSFLKWEFPLDRPDLAGYLIRTAIGNYQRWEDAVPCHAGVWPAPPFPVCNLPRGEPRTFAVRAVDVDGNLGPVAFFVVNRGPYEDAEEVSLDAVLFADPFLPSVELVQGVAGPGVLESEPLATGWHPVSDRPAWSDTPSTTAGWGNAWGDLVVDFTYDIPAYATARERLERVLTVLPVVDGKNWRLFYKLRDHPGWTGKPEAPGWTGLPGHRGWTPWGDDAPGWGDPADPGWSADPNTPGWGKYRTPWLPWPGRLRGLERQRVYFRLLVPGGRQKGVLHSIRVRTTHPKPIPDAVVLPTTLPPSGPAGGALSGTYPNPGVGTIPGRYLGTTVLATPGSGTFTKQAAATTLVVEMVGAGGGGGGADTAIGPPPPTAAAAGGGAAGAYLRKTITGAAASYPYTVGAFGPGDPGPGGGVGTPGGNTTFGSGGGLLTAPGGGGGAGQVNTLVDAFTPGAVSGLATGGDVNGLGAPGMGGKVYGGATVAVGGMGGSSAMGGGGGDEVNNGPGLNAGGPGGGGGGGSVLGPGVSPGGNGSDGLILVHEYS